MGSGKTKKGKKLASKLNLKFIDLDEAIEDEQGMSIREIFDKYGEQFFRETEHSLLKRFIDLDGFVLSTGGGTPCFFNNMEMMNHAGITIYLKADSNFLLSRLEVNNSDRPLINGMNRTELDEFISKSLEHREKFYKMSSLTFEAVSVKVSEIVSGIFSL